MTTELRTATAYHEAGHAVAALALGRSVDWVSIRPARDFSGRCFFRKSIFRPSEDWIEREALIALAGLAAEAILTGRYAWEGAARDEDYVRGILADRAGNERRTERILQRCLSKAEHLLSRGPHWQAVEKIAQELLRVEEISGRTVKHLFESALRAAQRDGSADSS